MIDIKNGRFTDILPNNLSSQPETQAFAYALSRQIEKLVKAAERVSFLTAISEAPEEILDYIAIELRTPCYKMEYCVDIKRSLILSTLPYYMKLGTTAMVNSIISTIFGNGHIIEFFEGGLEPHHFQVSISGAEETSRPTAEFRDVLEAVKRKSQWLDAVLLIFSQMNFTLRMGGALATVMSTPIPEQPDNISFGTDERVGGRFSTVSTTIIAEITA